MTTEYPAPEQRVRDFLSASEMQLPEFDYIADVATYDPVTRRHREDYVLNRADIRDVLNELEEHRQILIQIDEALDKQGIDALLKIRVIMGHPVPKKGATE